MTVTTLLRQRPRRADRLRRRPRDRRRAPASAIFERFYTGDEVGGSGLGLAIARELARRMRGPTLGDRLEPRLHRLHARLPRRAGRCSSSSRGLRLQARCVTPGARWSPRRCVLALTLARLRRPGRATPPGTRPRQAETPAGDRRGRGAAASTQRGLRGRRPAWSRSSRSSAAAAARRGGGAGQGSGFVISTTTGEIVTNAHVVTDARRGGGPPQAGQARSSSSSPTATRCRPRSSASTRSPTSRC